MATDNHTSDMPQKTCTKCGLVFPATDEYFHKKGDKLKSACKPCVRESNRESKKKAYYRDIEKTRARQRSDAKLFRQRHPEKVREQDRERRKKRQEENPELERQKAREKFKRRYATDPRKHIEKSIRGNNKRKAEKLSNTTDTHYTQSDVDEHLKSQKGLCWWCGKKLPKKYHIDHRIPLIKGGSNSASNICLACPKCNLTKSDKMPWEWNGRLL